MNKEDFGKVHLATKGGRLLGLFQLVYTWSDIYFEEVAQCRVRKVMPKKNQDWDVFISHASEDKEVFVRPLAQALQALGISVWYDEFSLRLGESLSRSIDKGIAKSRYGLVVISPSFIEKAWPEYELRGLITREIEGRSVIIPIWHGVDRKEVVEFSPSLADKVAVRTVDGTAQDIAIQILAEVCPDLYQKHPRSDLQKLASGEAIKELQDEIDSLKEHLSEYQCPFCGAPAVERISAPADPEGKHWGMIETYECGFETGGALNQPCPSDPKFPAFSDLEIECHKTDSNEPLLWYCYVLPKSYMAHKLSLDIAYGRTRDEAHARLVDNYNRRAKRWSSE